MWSSNRDFTLLMDLESVGATLQSWHDRLTAEQLLQPPPPLRRTQLQAGGECRVSDIVVSCWVTDKTESGFGLAMV